MHASLEGLRPNSNCGLLSVLECGRPGDLAGLGVFLVALVSSRLVPRRKCAAVSEAVAGGSLGGNDLMVVTAGRLPWTDEIS